MDSQKRLLIALGLSFLVTLLYTQFVLKPNAERELAAADAGAAPIAQQAAPDAGAPLAAAPAPEAEPVAPAEELPPAQELSRTPDKVHYRFTTAGAGLTQAELQGPKMREQQQLGLADGLRRLAGKEVPPAPQMDMAVPVAGKPLPLSVSIAGAQPLSADARYRVEEGERKLVFSTRQGPWEVKKSLEWTPEGYELSYVVEVRNLGEAPLAGELGLHYVRAVDPEGEQKPSFFGSVGNLSSAICTVQSGEEPEVQRQLPDEDQPTVEHKGGLHFFGIDQQYFLAALYPVEGPREGRCVLNATPTARATDAFFPLSVAPGQTATFRFGVFIGPKDDQLLAAVPTAGFRELSGPAAPTGFNPELSEAIDLGWWAVIGKVLLPIMKFFHGLFGNWGVAIILLTLVVKIALLPLTHKSMVSAEAMKKLQPRMEEIRKKFADDRERQNLEMMKLYQEAKVNPLGGCLPLLPQLPIWGGLFAALRTSYDLYNEPFISPLWTDLTVKDPAYILPVALGVTMVITQRMQPQMMDATQAKIMTYVMPVFFTVIMLQYPAGLSLYIFTNNLLSIAQQHLLRRYLQKKGIAAPAVKREPEKKPEGKAKDKKGDKRKMKEREV